MNAVLSSDILSCSSPLPLNLNKKHTHTTLSLFFLRVFRKIVTIDIIDRDQYQRNETFLLRLGEPTLINDDAEQLGMCTDHLLIDSMIVFFFFSSVDITEEEKLIADLGKPKLGDKNVTRIRIRESKEFKNAVDKALYKANTAILVGTSTWLEQFKQAFNVKGRRQQQKTKTLCLI